MVSKRHYVIYVPGLADNMWRYFGQAGALSLWGFIGVRTHYFKVDWANKDEELEQKLQRLLGYIDRLHAKGYAVSLVGASAGASLAILALHRRPDQLNAVVTICGKLLNPQTIADAIYDVNPSFRVALERYLTIQPRLTKKELQKILCVVPQKDDIVPVGDATVNGAKIEHLPTSGHVRTIAAALLTYRQRIIAFIHR